MSTVVVLGMHRSGTSCVTQALHCGGMRLGAELLDQTASDNLEGHWEAVEAVRINDAILAASDAAWDRIPDQLSLVAPAGVHERISAFLAQLAVHKAHGFKDPRTLITYPLWKPHLADARIVACLRHPYNVARSLARRHAGQFEPAHWLALWEKYNSRLLECVDAADPQLVYWFDFDVEPEQAEASLRWIVGQLGLNAQNGRFNSFLRHHEQQGEINEPRLAELYRSLRARAAEQQSRVALAGNGQNPLDVPAQLGQLRRVHGRHDELLQKQQAGLVSLMSSMQAVHLRFDALEAALSSERKYYRDRDDENSRRYNEIHDTLRDLSLLQEQEQGELDGRLSNVAAELIAVVRQQRQQQAHYLAIFQQMQARINELEQRGLWRLLKRKSRSALRRLRHGLASYKSPARNAA